MQRSKPALALAVLSTAVLLYVMAAPTAMAAAESWQVDRISGQAWVTSTDGQTTALAAGMELLAGATLSTGTRTRVMLVRGAETMMVGPKSVVAVSEHPTEGLTTTVLEKAGEVQFDVEKRNVHYFSVETPMLAAVVKGTHFTVSVGRANGGVQVARGTVEVTALATGQVSDVTAGQHAHVNSRGLSVGGVGHPSVSVGQPRAAVVSGLTTAAPTTAPTASFTQAELSAVATVTAVSTDTATSTAAASTTSHADHSTNSSGTPAPVAAVSNANVSASVASAMTALGTAFSGTQTTSTGAAASMGLQTAVGASPSAATASRSQVQAASTAVAKAAGTPGVVGVASKAVGPASSPANNSSPSGRNSFAQGLAGLARGLIGLAHAAESHAAASGLGPGAFGRGR